MTPDVFDPGCLYPRMFVTPDVCDPGCFLPRMFVTPDVCDLYVCDKEVFNNTECKGKIKILVFGRKRGEQKFRQTFVAGSYQIHFWVI